MQIPISGISEALHSITGDMPKAETARTPSFANILRDAVAQVQGLETQAAKAVDGLMAGDGVDVHTALIATQKADAAFEMALSVRNKAVAAYQQLMGTQF